VLDLGRTRPEEAGRGGGRGLGFGKEVAGSGSRRGETKGRGWGRREKVQVVVEGRR
jgi:hypothetical protein